MQTKKATQTTTTLQETIMQTATTTPAPTTITTTPGLRVKATVKAGYSDLPTNHSQPLVRGLRVKSTLKAGGCVTDWELQHNQTLVPALVARYKSVSRLVACAVSVVSKPCQSKSGRPGRGNTLGQELPVPN